MANTYVQIGSTVTVGSGGAATMAFSSIPATFTDLKVEISDRNVNAGVAVELYMSFNGLTTNQSMRFLQGSGSAASSSTSTRSVGISTSSGATANTFSNTSIYIPNYAGSTYKSFSVDSVGETNATTQYMVMIAGLWSSTAAISSLSFSTQTGVDFAQYSTATLYGIKSS